MSYETQSIPTKIGSITFFPVGFTFGNKEAAISVSRKTGFKQENPLVDDEEELESIAQNFVQSAITKMKKDGKVVYVAMLGNEIVALYSESLKNPEIFANGIIPFIETGDIRKFSCNDRFFFLLLYSAPRKRY